MKRNAYSAFVVFFLVLQLAVNEIRHVLTTAARSPMMIPGRAERWRGELNPAHNKIKGRPKESKTKLYDSDVNF